MLLKHPCIKAMVKATRIANRHRPNRIPMIAITKRDDLAFIGIPAICQYRKDSFIAVSMAQDPLSVKRNASAHRALSAPIVHTV